MFNLNDIIQAAQGGQGISNLAAKFGLSPEQAQAAVNAVIPAVSHGLQQQAQTPGGLGSIIGSLASGVHRGSFQTPGVDPAGVSAGGDVLGQIFGSPHVTQQVAQQAAGQTGLRPDILAQMLPAIVSMVMGGMSQSMQNQGLGGILSQLTQAGGSGGLGAILGQVMGGAQGAAAAPQQQSSGLGGILSSLFGSLLGGRPPAAGPALPGGLNGAAVQAGIDALGKMMQPGMQVGAGHQAGLQDILGQLRKPAGR